MIHFPVALALLLHVLFWGAGLAMLTMPRAWRRFWPVLVVPAGLALQSAVVWAGVYANFPGTNSYAACSEVVPAALLAVALARRGTRAAWIDLQRIGVVWLTSVGCLLLMVAPLAWASKHLTTLSLGSCDAGDYGAGARVLQEFARTERGGFLGLTEVVRVQSVDNFFDYWTRLNHFTPSALIAFNGSVLGCESHELTSLLTMVLAAGSLPVVFWMARAVIGFGAGPSVAVALLYGLSPLTWYIVGHVAPGQLLAAMAVGLITWAGVAAWRGRLTWRRGASFAAVFALGYWLLLGSYNFFVVLCLVPAVAYAGGLALWHGEWRRFGQWLVVVLAPLVGCGLIFAGRVTGLIERFQLLQTYDFGWKIPALTPEGWLGLVSGPDLEPWHFYGLRWVLAATVLVLLGWATARAVSERRRKTWGALAVTVPVLAGYAFLEWRGARMGTNASYDAFKLFAVFYPVMLPAFCWWITLRWSRRLTEWLGVLGVAGVVLLGNTVGTGMIFWRMCAAPLIVDAELRKVRVVEARPEVSSVNVLLPDMWSRLWANAFLLKKPQYFLTDTYEGRWHTALKGEWDLQGGLVAVTLPEGASVQVSPHHQLTRRANENWVKAEFGAGWNGEEFLPGTTERWRWSKRAGEIVVENAHAQSRKVALRVEARGLKAGEVVVKAGGAVVGRAAVTEARGVLRIEGLTAGPGRTIFSLESGDGRNLAVDSRELGVCVWRVEIVVSGK
ncbi:MAG: hypothetical protein NTV51_17910 [Verrucomicrobia bacterium]|nr:hypothetical protein [Verrucomicrobiota bacterium]